MWNIFSRDIIHCNVLFYLFCFDILLKMLVLFLTLKNEYYFYI